ncbi:ABC transporter permease subunit [Mycoplasma elephantis]|uniref:ABC transporter permease subunit n=1 Tax=Mycoplasma elephantis TaxID=114882 RepID=UPI000488BEE2|nr:ABC transporter permease [Mycoplasma elephantis]
MGKINNFGIKVLKYLRGDSISGPINKIKGSIFAIFLGLLVSCLPMLLDVFSREASISAAFISLFTEPLSSSEFNKTVISISIFILVGCGIGISFKTGLFNIGAAGQMMLAGGLSVIISLNNPFPEIPHLLWVLILLVFSIIVGALLSGVAGFLKAFFNVHEVIATIMLNWIVYYFVKVLTDLDKYRHKLGDGSKTIGDHYKIDTNSFFEVALVFVIVLAIIGFVVFVFKYTKLGFSMKLNGLNTNAAKYSGINNRLTTIYSMIFSGALIGAGGYLYYSSIQKCIPQFTGSLDSVGFEAITVTLLAFSSPLGSIPAGIFYGIIFQGTGFAYGSANMSKETFGLVIGIIIIFASLSSALAKVHPYIWARNKIIELLNNDIKFKRKDLRDKIEDLKNNYKNISNKYLTEQNEIATNFKLKVKNTNEMNYQNFELAKSLNYHSYIKKYLQFNFIKEMNELKSKLNSKDISIEEFSMNKRKLLYIISLEEEKYYINFLKNEKVKYISNMKSIKNDYRIYKNSYCNDVVEQFWNKTYAKINTYKHPEVLKLKEMKKTELNSIDDKFKKVINNTNKNEYEKEWKIERNENIKKYNLLILNKQLEIYKKKGEK